MLLARSCLVVTSRAARLAAPLDGVTTALDDLSLIETDAATAAALGFAGKLCIHPRQVSAVNAAFSPSQDDIRRARQILDSVTDGGAGRLHGQMIDRPVVERARLILRRAGVQPAPDDRGRP
jgi:citrate lyase subunit beta/citryl-CoA lyase